MDTTPNTNLAPSHHITDNLKQALAGMHIHFPKFKHEQHAQIININEVEKEHMTVGQKVADAVAAGMGSWPFIITQSIILAFWIILNVIGWAYRWDSYPFVFLNLMLSFQAAYAAPFILMSQNRQSEKDRLTAQNDYITDVKGEQEICHIMEHLDHQDELTREILLRLEAQNKRLEAQDKLILQMVQQLEGQHQGFADQHQEILRRLSELQSAS